MAVDFCQLSVYNLLLVKGLLQMLVKDVYGFAQVVDVLVDGIALRGERLFDSDILQSVSANGVDFWGDKRVTYLPIDAGSGCC